MRNRIRYKYYVGFKENGEKQAFRFIGVPDYDEVPYTSITGPFRTLSGAEIFARNPEAITMQMAENIARSIRKHGIVKEDASHDR